MMGNPMLRILFFFIYDDLKIENLEKGNRIPNNALKQFPLSLYLKIVLFLVNDKINSTDKLVNARSFNTNKDKQRWDKIFLLTLRCKSENSSE